MIQRFTLQNISKLLLFVILMLLTLCVFSQDSTKNLKIAVIGADTVCYVPIQYIRNLNEVILLNEANVEYGLILKEKLHDCQLVDSAYSDMIYQYKQVVILKNVELSIVNDRLVKTEYRYEKELKIKKLWRKVAIPSLGLNILLILLLL